MNVRCPSCGVLLNAAEDSVGKKNRCPKCSEVFIVPGGENAPPPEGESPRLRVRAEPDEPSDDDDRPSRRRQEEEDRPSRRRSADDDEDDYDDRPRRRRYEDDDDDFVVRCPYCRSRDRPISRTQISQAGWVTFALLLFFCWPLFWIGLLIQETYTVCSDCGRRLSG